VASGPVIGVDVGGTKMNAALVHDDGRFHGAVMRPTPTRGQDEFLSGLEAIVDEVRDGSVAAIGLGLPSTIDQRAGRVVSSVNIPLADVDVRGRMAERFDLPVGLDNDGNAATIAEWKVGAGRGVRDMIMLTLGTGIGGGLILNGKPYRGSTGAGAELGHMVIQYGGPACAGACTGSGHFETLASGRAADEAAERLLGGDAAGLALVEAARAGKTESIEALAEIGRRLGAGIASLINIFEPELVVLGGGFGQAADLLVGPAREVVAREALPPGRDTVRIVTAELGPRAGLVGAGFVGYEALAAAGGRAGQAGRASERRRKRAP
jgi:glucokinase